MSDWVCYMIVSLTSNDTYIGSSNNQPKRLKTHNSGGSAGAKYTRGQTWIPVLIVSGFNNKKECLSFESGWKKLAKKRNNFRLCFVNLMANTNYKYTREPKWNRIMDLLYFIHNFTLLGTKFKLNYDIRHIINQPDNLTINIFLEDWIEILPWPYFITTQIIEL